MQNLSASLALLQRFKIFSVISLTDEINSPKVLVLSLQDKQKGHDGIGASQSHRTQHNLFHSSTIEYVLQERLSLCT